MVGETEFPDIDREHRRTQHTDIADTDIHGMTERHIHTERQIKRDTTE